MSRLLSVLKIAILMLAYPSTPLKISLPENETTVNLKSASFIVMLLHKNLTHIHSQIKPWLLFGESFTLKRYCLFTPNLRNQMEHIMALTSVCFFSVFPPDNLNMHLKTAYNHMDAVIMCSD